MEEEITIEDTNIALEVKNESLDEINIEDLLNSDRRILIFKRCFLTHLFEVSYKTNTYDCI